jgi:hypothetical protein
MVGSFYADNYGSFSSWTGCYFVLDGNTLWDSHRSTFIAPGGETGICSTNAARDVAAGNHTITFGSSRIHSIIEPIAGTFHLMVIPHG